MRLLPRIKTRKRDCKGQLLKLDKRMTPAQFVYSTTKLMRRKQKRAEETTL
jgi:hypothetical protein